MRILYLSAEAAPLVKVGGLADVAGSLPQALRLRRHDVRVMIPWTGSVDAAKSAPRNLATYEVSAAFGTMRAAVSEAATESGPVLLVSGPPIASDRAVYDGGAEENASRFIFFARAALEASRALGFSPDIVHANDWHTAAAPAWLATMGRHDSFFARTASVLTLHNLGHPGRSGARLLAEYGIFPSPERAMALPSWGGDSVLALGMVEADALNTVSPTYAREILEPEFGGGFESLLNARRDRLAGILNGIDVARWNPASDPSLPANFDLESLDRRRQNKEALQRAVGIDRVPDAPLVGIVSRLDRQKGLDIAVGPLRSWLDSGGQCVVLGTGDSALEHELGELGWHYRGRASVQLRFDAPLSSLIYGGADMLLIPSRYEPCGLTQMIAMRYGAIPVARRTGGLADTITDAFTPGGGTGFMFDLLTPDALGDALWRARQVYASPDSWREIVRRAMSVDFSWSAPSGQYEELYRSAAAFRASR